MDKEKIKTILVIEDDRNMQEALSIILEDEGYKVMRANNGKEALKLLADDQKPGLILLDMIMPEMNGWEFAEHYRKQFTDHAPIIVISGAADVEQRAREVVASAYLSKPYVINEMLKLVEELVR